MPNQKLGVTANELFACNPFRILGLPVTADENTVASTYKQLLSMAGTAAAESYTTEYDIDWLPSFKRDEATLKTAYAKLDSIGYRCFAYSDGEFSVALNVDDIMLNLQDIQYYDVFLRCYMWLVKNDRDFEETELWVPIAKYIDRLIKSSPNEWGRLFDSRFPKSMLAKGGEQLMTEFHQTFSEIILLPLKEMVRGSMRCTSALQILQAAKVDVNEVFPKIDIPQANKPQPGRPAPRLKIAVKDGEEYFDVNQGKMVNFTSESEAVVETNNFSAAASSISADILTSDTPIKPAAARRVEDLTQQVQAAVNNVGASGSSGARPQQPVQTQKPAQEHKVSLVDDHIAAQSSLQGSSQSASQPSGRTSLVEEEAPVKHVDAIDTLSRQKRVNTTKVAPQAEEKPQQSADPFAIPDSGSAKMLINAQPDEYTKKRNDYGEPLVYRPDTPSANVGNRSLEAIDPFASAGGSLSAGERARLEDTAVISNSKRKGMNLTGLDGIGEGADEEAIAQLQFTAPTGYKRPVVEEEEVEEKKQSNRSLTHLINQVDSETEATANAALSEQEREDELYTDTLIKLLRSNRSNKMMQDVDTTHVYLNGGGSDDSRKTTNITMDEINMKKIDTSRLDAAYGTKRIDDSTKEKAAQAIKDKYKNINIADMLDPTAGKNFNKEYHDDVFKEYVKNKETEKKISKSLMTFFLFVLFAAAIVVFLWFFL